MNYALLDKIATTENGFLATILTTDGHTYEKAGARALFRQGDAVALHGNLGSLCADQDILDAGQAACDAGRPRAIRIDTSSASDADVGYGTFCGGAMEVLVEPLGDVQRAVYRDVRAHLERGETVQLCHYVESGALLIGTAVAGSGVYVETIAPARRVMLFGATPLARRVAHVLDDSDFDVHVSDWRSALLDRCDGINPNRRHLDALPLTSDTFIVVLSHSYRRDMSALRAALDARCPFVGMLSSRPRRARMFEELVADGVAADDLARVASPVGLDIGARGDAEIAVAIAAQLIEAVRR